MPWFTVPSPRAKRERPGARVAVDTPTLLHVSGIAFPVSARIVEMSLTECRVRSWIVLDRGSSLEFTWEGPHEAATFAATIVSRSASKSGPVYEYAVEFTGMARAQTDALARQLAELQRRARMNANVQPLQRAYSARATFPVEIRVQSGENVSAAALELSCGGMRIFHEGLIARGEDLTVRFRLPSIARASEELQIRARIVERGTYRTRPALRLIFTEIDGYTREQIARFVHAAQLKHLSRPSQRTARERSA